MSLVAQTADQVRIVYPEESRYFLARKIAICWFRALKRLDQASVRALQKEMRNKTFVGSFVGDSELVELI